LQGKKEFNKRIYYNIDLDSLVPDDHFLKRLDSLVSFDFVRDLIKEYYSHTGYPGGLKTVVLKDLLANKPEEVVKKAVWGMIPHNTLGRAVYKKLKVYSGSAHPHEAQNPQEYRF